MLGVKGRRGACSYEENGGGHGNWERWRERVVREKGGEGMCSE